MERAVEARSLLNKLSGKSGAYQMIGSDKRTYAVKPQSVRRALIADRIVGVIGWFMEAPVAQTALVSVSEELLDAFKELQPNYEVGLCHGTVWRENVFQSSGFKHLTTGDNPERFSALAVLYGFFGASDHQFLYLTKHPHLVTSHDHGQFLPMPERDWDEEWQVDQSWTIDSLRARGRDACVPDDTIALRALCPPKFVRQAAERLHAITDEQIAYAVRSVPSEWGISLDERIEVCSYLSENREAMYQHVMQNRTA
jgi:hypothetical protein